jgi:hypothetical protein
MTHSTLRRKYPFTRFASLLQSMQCLALVLVLAQAIEVDSSSNTGTPSDSDSNSVSDTDQTPPEDTITKVPAIISDAACNSGQRKVVKIYKNGALMTTERKGCVE